MNYQKIHNEIIERGKKRGIVKYKKGFHRHHILPRSLGGSDEASNLVLLTYREHFLIHKLLAFKLFPEDPRYQLAFWRMCTGGNSSTRESMKITSRDYDEGRRRHSLYMSKDNPMANSKRFGSLNPFYGKKHTKEFLERKSKLTRQQWLGHKKSQETKDKIGKAHKGKTVSEQTREKLRQTHTEKPTRGFLGKTHSLETKEKLKTMKPQIKCPYCKFIGRGEANMKRWHFDNCKRNPLFKGRKQITCPKCKKKGDDNVGMRTRHFDNCGNQTTREVIRKPILVCYKDGKREVFMSFKDCKNAFPHLLTSTHNIKLKDHKVVFPEFELVRERLEKSLDLKTYIVKF